MISRWILVAWQPKTEKRHNTSENITVHSVKLLFVTFWHHLTLQKCTDSDLHLLPGLLDYKAVTLENKPWLFSVAQQNSPTVGFNTVGSSRLLYNVNNLKKNHLRRYVL